MPDTAEFVEGPIAAIGAESRGGDPREQLFVRALDLPTLSIRQAKAAVTQQLDILSPLPPAEVVSSVVLMGPVEEGLNRFAVGFAPKTLLTRSAQPGERAVTLTGLLDGEEIAFRFDVPGAAPGKADWGARLELATTVGLVLAILLAALSLRLDREIEQVQARVDDANTQAQRLTQETASLGRTAAAWRLAQANRNAGLLDCAFGALTKANGGPVSVSKVGLANGQFGARLATPASDPMVTALRALGFAAAAPPPTVPAAPAPAVQTIQTTTATCR